MSQLSQIPKLDPTCWLAKERQKRFDQGRDFKLLITARDSATGTGKTTLGVWLALNWDSSWVVRRKSDLHVREFIDLYNKQEPGAVLLMDEAEQLDARRSMSHKNLDFAEKWMMMRFKQVDSILTLPTASALDKRLIELSDARINVTQRGLANVYKVIVDDHSTEVKQKLMHRLQWPNLDGTQVMADVDDLKDRKVHGELYRTEKETQQDGIQDPQQIRNKYILNGNAAGFTYEDLGNIFDISSGRVGQIVREQEEEDNPD
jgi:Zonular occludens toxin (Zot).